MQNIQLHIQQFFNQDASALRWLSNDHCEFTGEVFNEMSIDFYTRERIKTLTLPNAKSVNLLIVDETLETINAPRAKNVFIKNYKALKEINAEEVENLNVINSTVSQINAQNVTSFVASHCQNLTEEKIGEIIDKLDLQKLEKFHFNDDDITQDIKKLDNNSFVAKKRGEMMVMMMPNVARSTKLGLLPSDIHYKIGNECLSLKDIDAFAQTNQDTYKSYLSQECQKYKQEIQDYKKENLTKRIHAYTDMRTAQTTGRVRSDVPVEWSL
jgi:hypothetical protein